jgi:cytochrome c
MSMHKLIALTLCVAGGVIAAGAAAEGPGLGVPVDESDIAAWDITVFPSGANLPPGRGTAAQGAPIYAEKCALCHGASGEGGLAARLVGGEPLTTGIDVGKTIANFWASATTLFDFTRRQMPWQSPRTLTDDEVYALTAYILAHHRRERRDECQDAARRANAESRRLHAAIPGAHSGMIRGRPAQRTRVLLRRRSPRNPVTRSV